MDWGITRFRDPVLVGWIHFLDVRKTVDVCQMSLFAIWNIETETYFVLVKPSPLLSTCFFPRNPHFFSLPHLHDWLRWHTTQRHTSEVCQCCRVCGQSPHWWGGAGHWNVVLTGTLNMIMLKISIYLYIYTSTSIYLYQYIYINMYIYIYIYIYVLILHKYLGSHCR